MLPYFQKMRGFTFLLFGVFTGAHFHPDAFKGCRVFEIGAFTFFILRDQFFVHGNAFFTVYLKRSHQDRNGFSQGKNQQQ